MVLGSIPVNKNHGNSSGRELPKPLSPLDWPQAAGIGREMAWKIRAEARRRRMCRLRLCAGTTLMLILAAVVWRAENVSGRKGAEPAVATRVTTPERRVLPDGSVAELGDRAEIAVSFSEAFRRIELLRGEAHFVVTRQKARPFVVSADGVEARAVGTAFAVARRPGSIDVVVTEGEVAVSSPGAAATAVLKVHDLASVIPAAPPQVTALDARDVAQKLAWRVPRFEFTGARLEEIVALFNAHGHVHLVLIGPELRDVKVSGMLRSDNIDALLELLAADHEITGDSTPEGTILRRRPRSS